MKIKLNELADLIGGKIKGDPELIINGIARIEDANPGELTFLYRKSYEKFLAVTKASAVIVQSDFKLPRENIAYVLVDDPEKSFHKIVKEFFTPEFPLSGVDSTAFIHPEAKVGKNCAIGKNVVVSKGCVIEDNCKIFHNAVLMENVSLGENSIIFPNVTVREECKIGKRNIIHSGAVIGSDGFGYGKGPDGSYIKIPQIGIVVLEDDVEIGANAAIDRAAMGVTLVKKGTKIDNLVQIAHNVQIGEHTAISSQCGISGSTKIGSRNILAGQVGIADHLEFADNVIFAAKSGVSRSFTKPGVYFGTPAKDYKTSVKLEAHIRNLPEYSENVKKLQNEIKVLKEAISKLEGSK